MQTKNLPIIGGNGNVGTSLRNGFVSSGTVDVAAITRKHFDDERPTFNSPVSLEKFDTVIMSVKPADAVSALNLIRGKIAPQALLLSTVSGLSYRVINDMLGTSHSYTDVVKLTLNTCVGTQNGIVVYTTPSDSAAKRTEELFTPITKKIVRVSGNEIPPYIVMVGSKHAWNIKRILLQWKKECPGLPLMEFLQLLESNPNYSAPYISAMEETCKKLWGNNELVQVSFESTVAHLLKVGCHTSSDLIHQIDIVATKNGCTRGGVDSYIDVKQTTPKFFAEKFEASYLKIIQFENEIAKDFKAWMKQKAQPERIVTERRPYFVS